MTSKDDLYGLILTGGKSTRMGTDKSALNYHGIPHVEYLFNLMGTLVSDVYLSARADQEISFTDKLIIDQFDTKGPINGILSAMKQHPGKAWLVLAVDLPFVNEQTIKQLIAERNKEKLGTALATQESGLPEPLVAIWEAHSFEALKQHHLVEDKRCPRRFMMDNEIELINPSDDQELFNANHPEEYEQAKSLLK